MGYSPHLTNNPICAYHEAELPRIYGPRWTRKNINRLRDEELIMVESERMQREAEMYRKHAKQHRYNNRNNGHSWGNSGTSFRNAKGKGSTVRGSHLIESPNV
jgi:hypothetical protein